MTQEDKVLNYMNQHGGITQKQAYDELGISRLSARIYRLCKHGFVIHSIWETGKNRFGEVVRWKKYRLGRKEDYDDIIRN